MINKTYSTPSPLFVRSVVPLAMFLGRKRKEEDRTLEQVVGKILAGRKLSPEGRNEIILSSHFLI